MSSIPFLQSVINPKLFQDDDVNFWNTFLNVWNEEFEISNSSLAKNHEIFLEIGACSQWLRPHQFRLTTSGGFAVPVGYGGNGSYGNGLPEFDWSVVFHWQKEEKTWQVAERYFGKKKLVCRVALPTRTKKHKQAVANVIWSSGTPNKPNEKSKMYYAFRLIEDVWNFAASSKI